MDKKLLQVDRLGYSYCAGDQLFSEVTFHLNTRERVALCGDNGVGKTTLMHLLIGLRRAKTGHIHAFDQACNSEADFQKIRRKIGFLFQDPDDQLFCPSVLEDVCFGPLNIGLTRTQAVAAAWDVLKTLNIEHLADALSHQLSGGQKRLVTLASVLVMKPEILLLDEPTNALDRHARTRLIETLQALPQAMLLVSHDQDFVAQLATRALWLRDGSLFAGEGDV